MGAHGRVTFRVTERAGPAARRDPCAIQQDPAPLLATVRLETRGPLAHHRHDRGPRKPVASIDLGDRQVPGVGDDGAGECVVILPAIAGCASVWRSPQLVHSKRRRNRMSVTFWGPRGMSLTLTRRVSWTLVVLNPQNGQRTTGRSRITTLSRSGRSVRTSMTRIRNRCSRTRMLSGDRSLSFHSAVGQHRVWGLRQLRRISAAQNQAAPMISRGLSSDGARDSDRSQSAKEASKLPVSSRRSLLRIVYGDPYPDAFCGLNDATFVWVGIPSSVNSGNLGGGWSLARSLSPTTATLTMSEMGLKRAITRARATCCGSRMAQEARTAFRRWVWARRQ